VNRRASVTLRPRPLPASGLWAAVAALVAGLALAWLNDAPVDTSPLGRTPLVLGFLMLAAWCAGVLAETLRLPRLTGYIVAGLIAGPGLSGLVPVEQLDALRLLDELALTFIALVAGGELRWPMIRRKLRSIGSWLGGQLVLTPLIVGLGVIASVWAIPGLGVNPIHALPLALLLGAFSLARSPAATVVVIEESRARGPFTDTVLTTTVALDTLVVLLFATAAAFSRPLVADDTRLDLGLVLGLGFDLSLSIALGLTVGGLIIVAIRYFRIDLPILLAAVAFLIARLAAQLSELAEALLDVQLHLEPLLMGLTCGILVQNVSRRGQAFSHALERIAPPIYVAFFALTGARLDLWALTDAWVFPLLLVLLRAGGLFVGCWAGAYAAGDPPRWRTLAGWTSISQAGVSLGLAAEVGRRFPELGPAVPPAMVATVAISQIVGPVLLARALAAVGETRPEPGNARDEQA
jgi:Kef-type K+ transport system membrane component KefB